jgi:hypothetical protein
MRRLVRQVELYVLTYDINVIVGSTLVGLDPTPCSALIEARHGGELVDYNF